MGQYVDSSITSSGVLDVSAIGHLMRVCVPILLSRIHYKEYLVGLINKHSIDPVVMMNTDELKRQLTKLNKQEPDKQEDGESDQEYRTRLIEVGHIHVYFVIWLPCQLGGITICMQCIGVCVFVCLFLSVIHSIYISFLKVKLV